MKEVFETVRWTCDVCGHVESVSGRKLSEERPGDWATWMEQDICDVCVSVVERALGSCAPSPFKVVDPGHSKKVSATCVCPTDKRVDRVLTCGNCGGALPPLLETVEIHTLKVGDEFTKEEGGTVYRVVGDSQNNEAVVYYRQVTAGLEALTTFVCGSLARVYPVKGAS